MRSRVEAGRGILSAGMRVAHPLAIVMTTFSAACKSTLKYFVDIYQVSCLGREQHGDQRGHFRHSDLMPRPSFDSVLGLIFTARYTNKFR